MFFVIALLFFIFAAVGEHPVLKTVDYHNAGMVCLCLGFLLGNSIIEYGRTRLIREKE